MLNFKNTFPLGSRLLVVTSRQTPTPTASHCNPPPIGCEKQNAMKTTIGLYFLAATAGLSLFCAYSKAAPISNDGFEDYNVGDELHSLNSGSGWSGAWNVTDSPRRPETTIINGGLGYAAGDISINGGSRALKYVASEGGISVLADRQMPAQTGTVYLSFLYQSFNTDGDDFIQAGFANGSNTNPLVTALDRDSELQVRSGTAGGSFAGSNSNDFETFFMVLRAEKTGASSTYNDIDLYLNPTSATEGLNTSTSVTSNSGLDLSSAAFLAIRKAFQESGDTMLFDEFRIGTTFEDVIVSPAGTPPAQQMTLFEDDFDLDPSSNGWTESTNGGTNPGDIFQSGGEVVLASDGAGVDSNDDDTRSITRTIDATGFEHLYVALTARENNTQETEDILSIQVDAGDGMGLVEVFSVNDDFGTTRFGGMLPSDLADSLFELRIEGVSNVEDFFLDNLVVSGRALPATLPVPEPSTIAIWSLICVGAFCHQRRRAG
jgi:hypothetical protein